MATDFTLRFPLPSVGAQTDVADAGAMRRIQDRLTAGNAF